MFFFFFFFFSQSGTENGMLFQINDHSDFFNWRTHMVAHEMFEWPHLGFKIPNTFLRGLSCGLF